MLRRPLPARDDGLEFAPGSGASGVASFLLAYGSGQAGKKGKGGQDKGRCSLQRLRDCLHIL